MDKFFCGKCGIKCLIATPEELKEKIFRQLTEDEQNEGYGFEGEFDGSLFHPTEDKEICFCEKCLTRIQNTEELFCFDYVYLCPDCREV